MKNKRESAGFTLVELVLVIAILGVLAVSALPNLFDINLASARTSSRDATVGAVQAGLSLYAANEITNGRVESYPALLETVALVAGTAASRTVPLFNSVLQGGVTAQWFKVNDTCYAYDSNGNGTLDAATIDVRYQYTAGTTGTFLGVGAC